MEQQFILKNNVPGYLVIDFSKAEEDIIASEEDIFEYIKNCWCRIKMPTRYSQSD